MTFRISDTLIACGFKTKSDCSFFAGHSCHTCLEKDKLVTGVTRARSTETGDWVLFRCLGEEEPAIVDHNADKRASSTESQGEAPLASGEECMADVTEISAPVSSAETEIATNARQENMEGLDAQRAGVSPLSEVAGEVVDELRALSEETKNVIQDIQSFLRGEKRKFLY